MQTLNPPRTKRPITNVPKPITLTRTKVKNPSRYIVISIVEGKTLASTELKGADEEEADGQGDL